MTMTRHVHHILYRFLNVTDLPHFFFFESKYYLKISIPLPSETKPMHDATGAAFFVSSHRNFF